MRCVNNACARFTSLQDGGLLWVEPGQKEYALFVVLDEVTVDVYSAYGHFLNFALSLLLHFIQFDKAFLELVLGRFFAHFCYGKNTTEAAEIKR